jgi:hypothetical protein
MSKQFDKLLKVLHTQGFRIGFLEETDLEAHRLFVEKNWPQIPLRHNPAFNRWKFRDPIGDRSMNLVVCKKDNEIVGQIGYLYSKLSLDGNIYDAYWGSNFRVNDELLALGIGAGLEIFASKHLPVILGNTPTPDALKYKKQLGYSILDGPRTMMLPLRIDHVAGLKVPDKFKSLIPVAAALLNPFIMGIRKIQGLGHNDTWTGGDAASVFPRIQLRQQSHTLPHIVHDLEFLNWRLNPPLITPDLRPYVALSEADPKEYAIFRITKRILYIHDYCFASSGSFLGFLKYVLRTHPTEKMYTVQFFANNTEEEQLFRPLGCIGFRRKSIITGYSDQPLFANVTKMYVDLYDGEGNL